MIAWLHASSAFPDVSKALRRPNGLLAAGGDLTPQRLLDAYSRGIFPWFSDHEPILWWSPDPRMVLFPEELKISRSLAKTLRNNAFEVRADSAFQAVVRECAQPREPGGGSWISDEMAEAYSRLHELGFAHSVEVWAGSELVGGLYGVALGRAFFGESMFARVSDASKVALVHLVRQLKHRQFGLIDCQMSTPHLASLGAREIPRREFCQRLANLVNFSHQQEKWRLTHGLDE